MTKERYIVIVSPEAWPGPGEIVVDDLGFHSDYNLAWDASVDKYRGRARHVMSVDEFDRVVAAVDSFRKEQRRKCD